MVHHSDATPLGETDVLGEAFRQELQPHGRRNQGRHLRAEIVSCEHDVQLAVRGLKDPLGVDAVELTNPGEGGVSDLGAQGHVGKDVLEPTQVHRRLELRQTIESVAHKDRHPLPVPDRVALCLDTVVIIPVRGRPMGVAIDLFDGVHLGERGACHLFVGL